MREQIWKQDVLEEKFFNKHVCLCCTSHGPPRTQAKLSFICQSVCVYLLERVFVDGRPPARPRTW